ncbi:ribonuclease H-like domain-containing protein [Tanacetum coccineum]
MNNISFQPGVAQGTIIKEINFLKDKGIDLIAHCKIRVGNGIRTSFWNDLWIGESILKLSFPRLYALENNKDSSVADKINDSITSSFRHFVRGGVESFQLDHLKVLLEPVILSNMEDRWYWDLNGDGVFRVKDARNLIDEFFLPKGDKPTRWVKSVPIKVNVFAWKLFLDRLPTRLNLARRNVYVPSLDCPLCDQGEEDTSHLFFGCSAAKEVMKLICRWWDLDYQLVESYEEWFAWFKSIRLEAKSKDVLEVSLFTGKYCSSPTTVHRRLLFIEEYCSSASILGPAPAIYASQPTTRPSALSTMPMQDPTWHMDTSASSHLNFNASNLSAIFDKRLFPSVHVGDGKSIPVTNTGHNIIPSHHRPLHLHNVLVTLNIIKNLIYVRQFTRDNNCTIEFDVFGFSMKDYLTRHILLRCDSSSDLYPVTKPLTSPSAFLSTSASTWHQRLGHPGDQVLRSLVSSRFISCNKEKSSHICHACQLGKHVKLPFHSSDSIVEHCFDIIHSDLWTSSIWRNAMYDEYNALVKNGTWLLVPRPGDVNMVRSMWLFKHKFHADGTLSRYKARLVANGSSQQLGVDFDETFSPVVKPATIRTVLSLAVSRKWPIHQLDVKNAFLNGDLSETVYMHQPPGFVDARFPNHVCRLQRSLYGLKQAPRAWFQRFAGYATRAGFYHSRCDSSLFICRQGSQVAYLLIYVDDIILTASSPALLQQIIDSLHNEFDMTDLGALNYFLGISADRNSTGLFLSQRKYALQLLERAHMGGYSITFLTVSSLFSMPIQQVFLYMHDPREPHFAVLKRILRYVRGTVDFCLQLYAFATTSLVGYTDADWAGCPSIRRSTSGYCVFLGNNLLSWSAKRQHTISRTSAEVEYRGVANVVAETAWLRNLLRELHSPLSTATLVYCDNVSAFYMSVNSVQHQRTKHIEIDIHFVRDMVTAGQVRVLHVPSRFQYNDIFTKRLPSALFEEFRSSLSLYMVLSVKNVVPDILESIIVRLDVKDLIRCKNICKLWHSFISSNRFVNAHLSYRYDSDRNNNNFSLRRICMSSKFDSYPGLPNLNYCTSLNACNVVGSSNGLVCIASSDSAPILLVNPSTTDPYIRSSPLCLPYMGFGYDSSSDDYKLGALCNGAIHWLMQEPIHPRHNSRSKVLIISFDLSTEEFKETPQPDYDVDYELNRVCNLGVIDECLCIWYLFAYPIWVMKSYNLKESWTLVPSYHDISPDQRVNDAIHHLEQLKDDCVPHMGFFTSHDMIRLRCKNVDICSPIYVQTLVSPHVSRRPKRKRGANNFRKVSSSNISSSFMEYMNCIV